MSAELNTAAPSVNFAARDMVMTKDHCSEVPETKGQDEAKAKCSRETRVGRKGEDGGKGQTK